MTETKQISIQVKLPSTFDVKDKLLELEKVNTKIKEGYSVTNVYCNEQTLHFILTRYEHYKVVNEL